MTAPQIQARSPVQRLIVIASFIGVIVASLAPPLGMGVAIVVAATILRGQPRTQIALLVVAAALFALTLGASPWWAQPGDVVPTGSRVPVEVPPWG